MSNEKDFVIENGVLTKYDGPGEDVVIPEGVTEIASSAFWWCEELTSLSLPMTLEKIQLGAVSHFEMLSEIILPANHPHFVLQSGVLFDRNMTTLLIYPTAKRLPEYWIPDGVTYVYWGTLPLCEGFHLHVPGSVTDMFTEQGAWGIILHAPVGSFAERFARTAPPGYCAGFVEEGEPIRPDESALRKERTLKEWRDYFIFSMRTKGVNISSYVRSSKVVYLPDVMGKSQVASVSKDAFAPDITVLCSKGLFAKLHSDNKITTVRSCLLDRGLFTEEEQEYLLAYLKKNREACLEKWIMAEDYPALEACFTALPKVKTLVEECLVIAERLGRQRMNIFLLQTGRTERRK